MVVWSNVGARTSGRGLLRCRMSSLPAIGLMSGAPMASTRYNGGDPRCSNVRREVSA